MNKIIFGKFVNNNSFFNKLDARFKLFATLVFIIFCFLDFHILAYVAFFGVLLVLAALAKLKFKPLFNLIKHLWIFVLILLVINLLTIKGDVWFSVWKIVIYKDAIIETLYIFLRLIMILMISNLLTATTTPNQLTYGIEFYLKPLKVFKINVSEIALMMSIAIRFLPTLLEEIDRITKAQTSRGVDFKYGKYSEKVRALTSVIMPMFISCFERADELSDAMTIKGYGMGKRSKYRRLSLGYRDLVSFVLMGSIVVAIFLLNGVII